MYTELFKFSRRLFSQRAMWKDGDIWTGIAAGIGAYLWFTNDPLVIDKVRLHFSDLLNVTSLIFGFALAALIFYIEAAGSWSKNEKIGRVADKIIDWHVWTIVCLLFVIGYILTIWSIGRYVLPFPRTWRVLHSVLVFLVVYCGGQILNHALTVWWSFRNRRIMEGSKGDGGN